MMNGYNDKMARPKMPTHHIMVECIKRCSINGIGTFYPGDIVSINKDLWVLSHEEFFKPCKEGDKS